MKPKWKSWTLRFFIVIGAASQVLAQFQQISPESAWIATALSVCGIVLRFKTVAPIVQTP